MNKLEQPCAETGAAVSAWRDIEAFEYVPGTKPPTMLLLASDGSQSVARYVPRVSSRTPPWWASVPGKWPVRPTHWMPLPPPPSSHDGLREGGLRVPAFAETGPLPSRLDAQHSDGGGRAVSALSEDAEYRSSRRLAEHVLDRPFGDPDDDLAVLARQLRRADERLDRMAAELEDVDAFLSSVDADTEDHDGPLSRWGRLTVEHKEWVESARYCERATVAWQEIANTASTALRDLLRHYVDLVNSGDAGNWDPESEIVVKDARAALAQIADQKTPPPLGEGSREAIENLPPLEASRDAEPSGAVVSELVEVLSGLVKLFDAYCETDGSHADAHNMLVRYPFWKAARAALAKARTTGGAA